MEKIIGKMIEHETEFLQKIDKSILKTSVIATVVFSMLANAYAYFNFYPHHDALNHMFQYGGDWERRLGRFLLPVLGEILGNITIPWIEGVLSMLIISGMVYLIARLLDFSQKWQVVLIAGVLSANLSVTEITSVFMWLLAAFLFSAFLSCVAVYLLNNFRAFAAYFLAVVCIIVSLGIYQGEISVALTLLVFAVIRDAFDNFKFSDLLRKWIPAVIVLAIALVIYFCLHKIILLKFNLVAPDSYNSLSNLSNLSVKDIMSSTVHIYKEFIGSMFGKNSFWGSAVCGFSNLIIFAIAITMLGYYLLKKKLYWYNKAIIIVGIVAFPVVSCLMDIVMQMKSLSFYLLYALFLFYVLMIFLFKECSKELLGNSFLRIVKRILVLCFAALMFENIIFSNNIYSAQKAMYERTLFVMGNILEEMEEWEAYEAGETEVVLIGRLTSNKTLKKISEKQILHGGKNISVTSDTKFRSFAALLGSTVKVAEDAVVDEYSQKEEVKSMPSYPNGEYCQMINEKMVIRLSE